MNRDRLIANMTDQIKEAQLKLGYAEETVRLYYPLSSLCAILEEKITDRQEFFAALGAAFEGWKDCPLGKLSFALHGGRVEISIPPEGVKYVHEKIGEPVFLRALIDLFRENHHCSIQDICRVFERFSGDYVCRALTPQKAADMGFDYVLYFKDRTVDAYYYCIKEEMGHTVYHRFTQEDYKQLLPSES